MLKKSESNQSSTISYWDGVIDPKGAFANYQDELEQLKAGNYQGLDFEKWVGHQLWSIRVNKSDRLLFTKIRVKGRSYLMLLEVVLNHDYHKSRFLKPSVLKNYLELHGQTISEELVAGHFQACEQDSLNLPKIDQSDKTINLSRMDFYNQKFIELDDLQLDAATKKRFPLFITGALGSGKSFIALTI